MIYNDAVKTNIEWLSSLDTEREISANLRRTSIIATIGPKTNSVEMMNKLRDNGMNIVRMNFSHGSYEYHQSVINNAREAERVQVGRPLAIALDTKGPEIRTGDTFDGSDIPISRGHELTITTDEQYFSKCSADIMYIDYKNICKVIEEGRIIYVDDGVLSFRVTKIVDDQTLRAVCLNNGKISSRKGVNLPKTDVDLPALSDKDKKDLQFGVDNGVDMVFASFIRRGEDVVHIRKVLGEAGAHIKIISKIENQQGVNNFDDILKETDGVMVARGDLGIEIPAPSVFVAQKMMIAKCNLAGKPVICATQMLESMTNNPRPTRAEVSDVGNSVLDGADCVMLSGETAKGSYPEESVRYMRDICLQAEASIAYGPLFNELRSLAPRPLDTAETTCCSAINAAIEHEARAIICLSTRGVTARLCSKYRPACPIIMVTREPGNARQAHLYRGVYPLYYPEPRVDTSNSDEWQKDVDRRMAWGSQRAIELGILKKDDPVVVIQGWARGSGHTSMLRIERAIGTSE